MDINFQRIQFNSLIRKREAIRICALPHGGEPSLAHVFKLDRSKDESLILIPRFVKEGSILCQNSDAVIAKLPILPNDGSHLSFHRSGVINVTVSHNKVRLCQPQKQTTLLFTIALHNTTKFEEFDLAPGPFPGPKGRQIMIGVDGGEILTFVSVFQTNLTSEAPNLPFVLCGFNDMEWIIELPDRGIRLHFSVWRSRAKINADIAIFSGAPPGGIPDIRNSNA